MKWIQPSRIGFLLCLSILGVSAASQATETQDGSVTVRWNNGFRIEDKTDSNLYYLRLRFGFQFRYTYLWFDPHIIQNDGGNWSNFYLRRARLFVDGNAPSRDWKYLFHLQLEPTGKVNLHDASVQWQKFRWGRFQFGRMKIPYGLEYLQSAFSLNGVERTLFSGETDVDGKAKDMFGNRILRFWPGGNANFPVGGHLLEGTLFPVGGMMLYRSQGININGALHVPGFNDESLVQYWIGVFNGRDTQGFSNPTDRMLYALRFAYAPLGEWNLTVQGDRIYSVQPKFVFLFSLYTYTDIASKRYDPPKGELVESMGYDIRDMGYNLAALLRFRGFSVDIEYGFEKFDQLGNTPETGGSYDRLGGRINLGYFLVPGTWEVAFKWAYLERIRDNNKRASLYTGLGLVETKQGMAVEKSLHQYTAGINFYLHGNNQKICLDYSFLVRDLSPANPGPSVDNQQDNRVRLMYQQIF